MKKNLVKFAFVLFSFSDFLLAESFTSNDIINSTKIAAETFKKEHSEEFYNKMIAIQALKSPKGSKVKIHYRDTTPNKEETDSIKSIEYFCHFHDAQSIDCHEL